LPKIARELTALQVKKLIKDGMHAVGGVPGLLLQVRNGNGSIDRPTRSWIYRARIDGRRIHLGLGSFPDVSLADARQAAREQKMLIKSGGDPIQVKLEQKAKRLSSRERRKTFKECAGLYLEHRLKSLTNEKHKRQWRTTLETYVYPVIGDRIVADITIHDVKDLLEQSTQGAAGNVGSFWEIKTETASRVLGRLHDVFAFAITKGFRTDANPAEWRGRLSTLLPPAAKLKKVRHQDAVPYSRAPHFMAALMKGTSITRKALAFLLITGVRSGSVRQAEWTEFDLEENVWTIPSAHEKTKTEHRVPLSQGAIRILNSIPRIEGCDLVFPAKSGKQLSDTSISKTMRQMRDRGEINYGGVPHGCRATFRTWAADKTNYSDEIRKAASGHSIGDAVKMAYQRGDLLEQRRRLMEDWSTFLTSKK